MLQQRIDSHVVRTHLGVSGLQEFMRYQNRDVVAKFCKEWDVTFQEAEDIFEETKKFLYLAARCQAECFRISVYTQFQVIDEMWHTFLQFTDKYYEFCEQHAGGFLHHFPFSQPMLKEEIKHVTKTKQAFSVYKQEGFLAQIKKTKEILGEDTVIKWYGEYSRKYSIQNLNLIRKPLEIDQKTLSHEAVTAELLRLPKDQILNFIMSKTTNVLACGCTGKGCGAGCSCNSREEFFG